MGSFAEMQVAGWGGVGRGAYRAARALALAMLLGCAGSAHAISESFNLGDDQVKMVLNNTFTAGAGIRMQSPSANLIGKGDLNPNVCAPPYQSCQGVFKSQIFPAQQLARAPGAASINGDDGDLNYGKYHLFEGVAKATEDLTISYKDFGIFARVLYFYDFVNNDFIQTQPNELTPQNKNAPGVGVNTPTPLLLPYPGGTTYGPGQRVREKRTDGEVLSQIGTNLQYLDSYFYGKLPIPWTDDKKLSFKIGRQTVNWGESTTLVINSINQANPVNANNFNRVGNQVEEDFVPVNMLDISFEPLENTTVETFYQLEWKPVEIAAPGSYFSDVDLGTRNAGKTINVSFGTAAYDPDRVASLQYNPLALLTNTTLTQERGPDRNARSSGQFGVKLDYYADWLNNGTDLSLYYMRYNSRLPYASFISANASCARAAGNPGHNDATDLASFLGDCPGIPLLHPADPSKATSSVAALDSPTVFLEYPNGINLIGASFNTTVGSYSIQGEVAYRPNLPLQVDTQDLAFAAFGPTLTSCSDPKVGCSHLVDALSGGVGYNEQGQIVGYAPSDFTPAGRAKTGYTDTINVIERLAGRGPRLPQLHHSLSRRHHRRQPAEQLHPRLRTPAGVPVQPRHHPRAGRHRQPLRRRPGADRGRNGRHLRAVSAAAGPAAVPGPGRQLRCQRRRRWFRRRRFAPGLFHHARLLLRRRRPALQPAPAGRHRLSGQDVLGLSRDRYLQVRKRAARHRPAADHLLRAGCAGHLAGTGRQLRCRPQAGQHPGRDALQTGPVVRRRLHLVLGRRRLQHPVRPRLRPVLRQVPVLIRG